MNRNKLFSYFGVVATLAPTFLAPSMALADDSSAKSENIVRPNVCERVALQADDIKKRIDADWKEVGEKRDKAGTSINERKLLRTTESTEMRAKEDARLAEMIAKLEEKAASTAEKAAVVEFTSDATAAISARRTAIDRANKIFSDGLAALLAERKTKMDAAAATYKSAISSALTTFQSNCKRKANNDESAMATYRKAIASARQTFMASHQRLTPMDDRLKKLMDTHKASVEKAQKDFRTAMEKARAELKVAFGEESSN